MQPRTTPGQWAFLFGIAFLTLLLDQISKAVVVANLALYERRVPIPALADVFNITYTRNTGAAFGILPFASNVFLVIAVVASLFILYFYRKIEGRAWLIRAALGLQMGGALGNALDRITRGYVVDFLHVFYEPYFNYPVFNLADSAIVIGVGILIILLWREDQQPRTAPAESSNSEPGESNP
ncbi:MAG: signal peptidase II [Anaerolineae bacterium]|nr:signal peptidase II [Anaerolineae bacterium]